MFPQYPNQQQFPTVPCAPCAAHSFSTLRSSWGQNNCKTSAVYTVSARKVRRCFGTECSDQSDCKSANLWESYLLAVCISEIRWGQEKLNPNSEFVVRCLVETASTEVICDVRPKRQNRLTTLPNPRTVKRNQKWPIPFAIYEPICDLPEDVSRLQPRCRRLTWNENIICWYWCYQGIGSCEAARKTRAVQARFPRCECFGRLAPTTMWKQQKVTVM